MPKIFKDILELHLNFTIAFISKSGKLWHLKTTETIKYISFFCYDVHLKNIFAYDKTIVKSESLSNFAIGLKLPIAFALLYTNSSNNFT